MSKDDNKQTPEQGRSSLLEKLLQPGEPYQYGFNSRQEGFPILTAGPNISGRFPYSFAASSLMLKAAQDRGVKTFIFDIERDHLKESAKFNILSVAQDDEGRQYLIDLFARMAQVELTQERRAMYLEVLAGLPADAAMRDFIQAARAREASELGVSLETYEAVSPLLMALRDAFAQKGFHYDEYHQLP